MPQPSDLRTFDELKKAAQQVCEAQGVMPESLLMHIELTQQQSAATPFAALEEVLEKIVPGNELQAYEFLEAATCTIINEPIREVVVQAIRVRKKWRRIKDEYQVLREADALKEDAVRRLSRKYHYSVKTIETIIYER